MEKKEGSKKGKKLIIDLNKKFQPKNLVATKQKWRPFGPFQCAVPPLSAKNLVFGGLKPFRGAVPTTISDGTPANDVNSPLQRLTAAIHLDQPPLTNGDVSAWKPLPLLPTTSRKSSEIPRHLAPSTMTVFYSGGVRVCQDISPVKAELVLEMAGKGKTATTNEVIAAGSEEIERSRWKNSHENPSLYVTEKSSAAPWSSVSSYQNFAPGAIAMARRATMARFLEKRKHRYTSVASSV